MNNIRVVLTSVALAATFLVPASASAAAQNNAQQACLNKVVKTARKTPGAILKEAVGCIRKGAVGKLPPGQTATNCLIADLNGKVAKTETKLNTTVAKSCPTPPDFGFIDATTTFDAYEYDNQALIDDLFGPDLDATLLASDGPDPAGRCSATLPAALRKLEDAIHRTIEACLKAGLKSGTVVDVPTYEACLDSVVTDSRGRVSKAVALVQKLLTTKCPAGVLDVMFPGMTPVCAAYGDATDAAGLATCSRDRLKCRVCRIFNFAYGLDRDCDLFDDTLPTGSCPDCGNTVVDSGEECDDGNEVSGDGCNGLCVDEFCGDGVINDSGGEVCDDGVGNSDTTPDACRLNCVEPICGDSVTDTGEECDDGNLNDSDGCTNACTSCGNSTASGAEQCDDGNNLGGDCCAADCSFEAADSPCVDAPSGDCTAPGCDGAGVCEERPANEGAPCDDGDECTSAAECQTGICTTTSLVVTGAACRWAVVGNPGVDNTKRMEITDNASGTGPWCANFGFFGTATTMTGDIVTTRGDGVTPGTELRTLANVNASNVISNNALVRGLGGENLPNLAVPTPTIAPGNVVAKVTVPTVYNTTGSHPLVADCQAAQLAISTNTATLLDALSTTTNLGASWTGIGTGQTRTATATNVGGLNVFDATNITGANNGITLEFDGGGNPNTVMIVRVSDTLNTSIGWTWSLINGMTADHLMIYGKGATNNKCEIGQNNVGSGTIFCPNGRIRLVQSTIWSGSLFGGGNSNIAIDVGDGVQFTHQRFTGF